MASLRPSSSLARRVLVTLLGGLTVFAVGSALASTPPVTVSQETETTNDAGGSGETAPGATLRTRPPTASVARTAATESDPAAQVDRGREPPSTTVPITSCTPPDDTPVAAMVAAIFRCRLTDAGFAPEEVEYATAEAVTVAHCESGFDPDAVIFDGRYVNSPHPATGEYYTAAGVFQFIRPIGDGWIDGGYANVHDPVENIDAAARLYIANLRQGYPPWSDWACAAVNDGFATHSVLPGWPGGPERLPAWAFEL